MTPGEVGIDFSTLWTYGDGSNERIPVGRLTDPGEHVHGDLRIAIRGQLLPSLGFFGPDDVCFNGWAHELHALGRLLAGDEDFVHLYDDGEQGQPAYEFRHVGNEVQVSVLKGSGGGAADPGWVKVSCHRAALRRAIEGFEVALDSALRDATGDAGRRWMARVVESA